MSSTSNNSKNSNNWGEPVKLTPEEIILWLESYRALMIEIWSKNPNLRERWEKVNK